MDVNERHILWHLRLSRDYRRKLEISSDSAMSQVAIEVLSVVSIAATSPNQGRKGGGNRRCRRDQQRCHWTGTAGASLGRPACSSETSGMPWSIGMRDDRVISEKKRDVALAGLEGFISAKNVTIGHILAHFIDEAVTVAGELSSLRCEIWLGLAWLVDLNDLNVVVGSEDYG